MRVTVIGGGGAVGATVAYTLAIDRPDLDVQICDIDEDAAWGHATDARHARLHASHPVGPDVSTTGDVTTVDPGPEAVREADYVVVTASVPRPEGGAERGGREAFWPGNRDLADEIAGWLRDAEPCPVVVVTNPADRMVSRLHDRSGWPRERFLGYSLSETARIADAIGRRADADPATVDCPILGEHGEHIVPAFSRATVDGEPLDLDATAREEILEYVRSVPYDVMDRRGRRDSSRWVTSRGGSARRRIDAGRRHRQPDLSRHAARRRVRYRRCRGQRPGRPVGGGRRPNRRVGACRRRASGVGSGRTRRTRGDLTSVSLARPTMGGFSFYGEGATPPSSTERPEGAE